MDLTKKCILVAGGSGFLGQHVMVGLTERGLINTPLGRMNGDADPNQPGQPKGTAVTFRSKLCKFTGKINWNSAYPDSQPRRYLDTQRGKNEFGFQATPSLEEGPAATIEWDKKKRTS
jgi:nucleoside-diphosphate-sugar epimerase